MIPLPGYIDREAWAAWMEVRKHLKAPNTDYALKLLLYEVQRIKDAGHDPNAAIKQSVLKGWKDVYQPKDKPIEAAPVAREDAERKMREDEQRRLNEYIARTTQPKLRSV